MNVKEENGDAGIICGDIAGYAAKELLKGNLCTLLHSFF